MRAAKRASCRTAAPLRTRGKTASYPGEREMEEGRAGKVSLASTPLSVAEAAQLSFWVVRLGEGVNRLDNSMIEVGGGGVRDNNFANDFVPHGY